jgi:ribosomal protein S13
VRRILNTNVDGRRRVLNALTAIKGIGRRFSDQVLKRADVDQRKRAGELTAEEIDKIVEIVQHPVQYGIPQWFLNRQNNIVDGKYLQLFSNNLDQALRDDLTRLRKIKYVLLFFSKLVRMVLITQTFLELIVVFVIILVYESEVNTPRLLVDEDELLECPRRSKGAECVLYVCNKSFIKAIFL